MSAPATFNPASLLALAMEAEATYGGLLQLHPPGTIHDGRNVAYEAVRSALACAAWMERTGKTDLAYVGPFGTLPFSRGARVRVRKGAVVYGIGRTRDGEAAKASRVVTVHSIDKGCSWQEGREEHVRQPLVHWAGSGGYWRWVDANDVELVS